MLINRMRGDIQLVANFQNRQALNQKMHDFDLSARERKFGKVFVALFFFGPEMIFAQKAT